ncbi:ABC transporter substrate-binding protein [Enteractinococcus helveticum]|uniref:SsuA/THI5-like domain-containing protein n=1 Tax=Enteractinococcus helveticum TaxID=1837282 RepID=A0A1B7M0P6_9MICC|nr:ABC transporter substrate-binding protein [Enteractinococcus helveticum]OAV61812.1 hypothetical protein A6F49_07915 [Enteractinococcus helveticum]
MNIRRTAASVAALGLTFTLAACGGGGDAASSGDAEEITTLNLGTLPIAASTAINVGIEEGIFEKHGLDIQIDSGQGGAATLPAVTTGDIDLAVGNPLTVLLADTQGLEVQLVAGYSNSRAETPDTTAIVVPEDSEIQDAADLAGATVAVNTLTSGGDLNAMEAVAKANGDPGTIDFVEVAFQDTLPQVEQGNVDAGWLVEPFLSQALANGHRVASWLYLESIPGGQPTMIVYGADKFVEENPEVVENFRIALDETLQMVQQDPNLVRDLLPELMNMPEEVAANLELDDFDAELDVEGIQAIADLMVTHGFTEQEPDVEGLIGQ